MMKPSTYAVLGLLAAGAGGFFAGRISAPLQEPPDASAGSPAPSSPRRASSERAASAETDAGIRRSGSSLAEQRARTVGSATGASARLDAIIRNEDALDRYRMMLSYIDNLVASDFEAAVSEFRALGMTESRFGEYAMLLSAWAKTDPTGALEYARANTNGSFATNTILASWASNDPESAIRWANENHTGEEANPFMVGIIRALAATDPARATQLITAMPRSVERGEALDGLLPSLLAQGNGATREWIDALQDEALRNGAIMRVAEKFAETDPEGTLAWLKSNPGEAAQRRVDDVYRVWAGKDEAAAMSAYKALPQGDERSNALRGIVSNLADSDPQAAVALMDQNASDVSERTVRHFAWQTFYRDPALAVDQIARVPSEESRGWMYRRLVSAWIERDKAAAATWLQRNAGNHPALGDLQRRVQQ